jgi:integrase
MRRRLTDLAVARLKPPTTGRLEVWDASLRGFGLRVTPSGARSWVVAVRKPGARHPARIKLGEPPTMALKEARRKAGEILTDPAAHFAAAARRDTVRAVAEEWLKRDQAKNRRVAEVRRMFAKDVLPALGDRPIAEVRKRDVIALVDAIADRGAGVMANRTLAHLKRLFRWAAARDIIEADPAAHVLRPAPEVRRERVLSADELRAIWDACEGDYPYGAGIKLLILTLARKSEVFELSTSEVDREQRLIRLPAARVKNAEGRTIPLSAPALEVLDALPVMGGGPYALSMDGRRPYSGPSWAKRRLDARIAELRGQPLAPWRLHDLRRSGATGLQRLGVRLEVIEAVLGHISGSRSGVIGIYQRHKFEDEARAALDAWGREVERIIGRGAAKVVAFR